MIEKVGDLLPIGTVVMLKNGTKKLMVFGIIQSVQENPDLEYNYIGVPYPEGNMGQDYQYLFNHADVDQVFFRGFEDVERQEFIYNLVEFYRKRTQ